MPNGIGLFSKNLTKLNGVNSMGSNLEL